MAEDFTNGASAEHRRAKDSLEYAGFWIRTAAALIDFALQMLITLPLLYAVYGRVSDPTTMIRGPAEFLISWIFPAVVVIWLWISLHATPGKLAIGARIVDADTGGSPTMTQYVIRYLAYIPSGIVLLLGFFWVGFDRRKQGWHDKMANTVVIRRGGPELVTFKASNLKQESRREPEF